ncbi:hydroxymethylglutaryl-CoA lyase [Petroclostridium sp. X23]|uniref:hydroxymethylglutaryl-CoA lyase n=1 Tax=Petroclostridium sp. X23 TaxID=3045146 RepID=UPI0024ADA05B|nr:hydroxymethylglutaryl-CoA lyase [Petroclostridium sp. X23]WHH57831.1 hydroxymethylglutaryl-CoA lyase [Petroclostridium sp. X23]
MMNIPKEIEIIEIGPRDGYQNIKEWIPTEVKLEIIDGLVKSNFKKMQVTSFVHPKAIPQMKDAKEIVSNVLKKYPDVKFAALVPNLYGARAAYESGLRRIVYVISASEAHNKANVNRTIDESFVEFEQLRREFPDIDLQLDVATAFGCPFNGITPIENVFRLIDKACEVKADRVSICDTIGVANPVHTENVAKTVLEKYPEMHFHMHFHDTRGMGLANAMVAAQSGIKTIESCVGGLGGCPFAPGATGNTATEDLVNMFEKMGVSTGVCLDNLLEASRMVKNKIGTGMSGHMVNISTDLLNVANRVTCA